MPDGRSTNIWEIIYLSVEKNQEGAIFNISITNLSLIYPYNSPFWAFIARRVPTTMAKLLACASNFTEVNEYKYLHNANNGLTSKTAMVKSWRSNLLKVPESWTWKKNYIKNPHNDHEVIAIDTTKTITLSWKINLLKY